MDILGVIADVTGIAGFIVTICLLIRSEALRKEIQMEKRAYQKSQKDIRLELIALRMNVWDDNILILQIVSKIRSNLYSCQINFKRLLSKEDKTHIKRTISMLRSGLTSISAYELCEELDYIIARLEKKEPS